MKKRLYCLMMILLTFATAAIGRPASESASELSTSVAKEPANQSTPPSSSVNETTSKRHMPQLSKQQMAQLQQDIYQYQQAIAQIESEQGVYGQGMSQQLEGLGSVYQYLGKHDTAMETFKRAIHLKRIHEGLYTESQIPIVEKQIASLIMLGKWKEVGARYQYIYWLSQQNFNEDDPRMLPALSHLSRWHLRAYAMGLARDREDLTEHLLQANSMIMRSINILERNGADELKLVRELNGLTLTNYLFATFQRARQENQDPFFTSARNRLPSNNDALRRVEEIDRYISHSFRAGRDAISRMIDIYENSKNAPQYSVANAKVKMGDWLFLFNKREDAFALYSEAYQLMMQEAEGATEVKRIFAQPVALPNNEILDSGHYDSIDMSNLNVNNNYVLASFDVTAQGKAANIEIIESVPPDNVAARARVKRSLRIAKFRPRFVAGEPTHTEKMQLRVLSR